MTYRWVCPHAWLVEHVEKLTDPDLLRTIIHELAGKHDHDTLQDLYQRYMDLDGYFEEQAEG